MRTSVTPGAAYLYASASPMPLLRSESSPRQHGQDRAVRGDKVDYGFARVLLRLCLAEHDRLLCAPFVLQHLGRVSFLCSLSSSQTSSFRLPMSSLSCFVSSPTSSFPLPMRSRLLPMLPLVFLDLLLHSPYVVPNLPTLLPMLLRVLPDLLLPSPYAHLAPVMAMTRGLLIASARRGP